MNEYDNPRRPWSVVLSSLKKAGDLLLPPRCPVTGDIVDRPGMIAPSAWSALRFISAPHCACCGIPFEVLAEGMDGSINGQQEDILCGMCLATPKPYTRARASLVYDDASRALILAFKHGDQTHLTVTFTPWLKTAGAELLHAGSILVPVPLHWFRLLRRRYNQAALLARHLSTVSGCTCWPDLLRRRKNTVTQGHLNARQRHDNVRNAFALNDAYRDRIKGRDVVLVDDVHTTGATLEACVKVLLEAGAQRVDVLTLARVVRPDTPGE